MKEGSREVWLKGDLIREKQSGKSNPGKANGINDGSEGTQEMKGSEDTREAGS